MHLTLVLATILSLIYFNDAKWLDDEKHANNNETCSDNPICNETYEIITLDIDPYSSFALLNEIQNFCGKCFRLSYHKTRPRTIEHINHTVKSKADFIFPVFGKYSFETYDGFYFLPFIKHPGFFYTTKITKTAFQYAIKSCIEMYPLIVICLFISFIYGFFVWVFEMSHTSHDHDERFTRSFPIGWFRGTWWSVISMFSTGPESTPKSLPARMLAVLWLLFAIIMVGIMTSIITAAMVKPFPTPKMDGKSIASVRFRPYNKMTILRHNGHIKTIDEQTSFLEMRKLFKMIQHGLLDGALVEKYNYYHFKRTMLDSKPEYMEDYKRFLYYNTIIENEDDLVYGLLVKKKTVYEYLKSSLAERFLDIELEFLELKSRLEGIDHLQQKAIEQLTSPLVFSDEEPFVKDTMVYLAVIVGVMLCFGLVYEVLRRTTDCFRKMKRSERVFPPDD